MPLSHSHAFHSSANQDLEPFPGIRNRLHVMHNAPTKKSCPKDEIETSENTSSEYGCLLEAWSRRQTLRGKACQL